MAIDLEKVSSSITKTGFHLEYKIGTILRDNGWHLISNRCYIDDHEGAVREIDLLGYKVTKIKDFSLYTVLVISCKKSESNAWALLTRAVEKNDPNYNWRPFKGWSNHPALSYYMAGKTWPHIYHEKLSAACPRLFEAPNSDVFAFQEINKNSGSVQNDKAIFSSITSLMKAQSYEMSLLEGRQKDIKRAYQFNLISIIDSELVKVFFDGETIESHDTQSEDYLCRYILNKEEAIARIKFTTADFFPELINDYNTLHSENKKVFTEHYEKFYADAYKTFRKSNLIKGAFLRSISPSLQRARYDFERKFDKFSDIDIYWNEKKLVLELGLVGEGLSEMLMASLNANKDLAETTKKALSEVFHYEGDFAFEEGIGF